MEAASLFALEAQEGGEHRGEAGIEERDGKLDLVGVSCVFKVDQLPGSALVGVDGEAVGEAGFAVGEIDVGEERCDGERPRDAPGAPEDEASPLLQRDGECAVVRKEWSFTFGA